MKTPNRIGLAILILCGLLMLSQLATAETLQMLPAHEPFRASADATRDAGWFGLLCCIGAILFIW